MLRRWILTESQTRKTLLDTHNSFFNKNHQACVEDDNSIFIKDGIVKVISFNGGTSGNTAVLVDSVNLFGKRASKKTNFKIKTGAKKTHELCWQKDSVKIIKSSNLSVTEIIQLTKLQKYANNDLFVKKNPELSQSSHHYG